jgi:hypothetical protein
LARQQGRKKSPKLPNGYAGCGCLTVTILSENKMEVDTYRAELIQAQKIDARQTSIIRPQPNAVSFILGR